MSAVPTTRRHRLSVDDYHKLAGAGIFAPDARVELIDGELIDMAPIGGVHVRTVNRLTRWLVSGSTDTQLEVSVQNPIVLPPHSEPQPDLSLVRPGTGVPNAADTLLVIEVSDSTLNFDREVKVVLYARAEIPELWIVDTNARVIHVYRHPRDGGYQQLDTLRGSDMVSALALPNTAISVVDLLGD
jgi:Uma2 family endonuclease